MSFVVQFRVATDLVCSDELCEQRHCLSEFGGEGVKVKVSFGAMLGRVESEIRLRVNKRALRVREGRMRG